MRLTDLIPSLPIQLLSSGTPILMISGGRDSMVLLAAMGLAFSDEGRGGRPVVFHLNHRLRPDALLDQALVEEESRRVGFECFSMTADVAALARRARLNLEEAGRASRYRAVRRLSRTIPGAMAVTAHHADDYLESVLLHLQRGGGPSVFETLPVEGRVHGIMVVRPLLPFSRADLARVAAAEKIRYREDPSNSDTSLKRNRLRALVVPLLKRDGLDVAALWRRFHDDPQWSGPGQADRAPLHVSLDRRLLFPGTARQIKRALDLALAALDLPPAGETFVRSLQAAVSRSADFRFRFETKQLVVWAAGRGPLWIFSRRDGLLSPPRFTSTSGPVVVEYGGRKQSYPIATGEAAGTLVPGLKVPLAGGGRKDLTKVFQELGIPLPIRSHIPLIVNEATGLVVRVCLSFWENGSDRVYAASSGGTD